MENRPILVYTVVDPTPMVTVYDVRERMVLVSVPGNPPAVVGHGEFRDHHGAGSRTVGWRRTTPFSNSSTTRGSS